MKRHALAGIAKLALVATLAGLGGQARAAAGEGREQREAKARQACEVGKVDEGIEILAALFTEYQHPNYVYNQARCLQRNLRAEEAIGKFREYLRLVPNAPTDTRERVERFIGELREQQEKAQAQKQTQGPALPASGQPPTTIPALAAAPTPPPPASPSGGLDTLARGPAAEPGHPSRARVVAAIALGGVAVAGAALGVISGLQVRSLERDVQNARPGQFDVDRLADERDRAQRFQSLQWVGYGVGGAALIAAAACLTLGTGNGGGGATGGVALRVSSAARPDGGAELGIAGRF